MDCTRTALEIYQKGVTTKNEQKHIHTYDKRLLKENFYKSFVKISEMAWQ